MSEDKKLTRRKMLAVMGATGAAGLLLSAGSVWGDEKSKQDKVKDKDNLENHVRPVINLLDYGALGDGIQDDTIAVQNALNDGVSGKIPVYAPAGTYKIGQITIPDGNLDFYGAGWGTTTFIPSAQDQTLFYRVETAVAGIDNITNRRKTFRDMAFSDPNGLGGCRAIYCQDIVGFYIENILFRKLFKAVEFNRGQNINLNNIMYYKGGRFIFDAFPYRAIAPSTYDYCKTININNVVDLLGISDLGGAAWFDFRDCVNIQMSNVQSPALMGKAIGINVQGKTEGFWANNVILVWPTYGRWLVGAPVDIGTQTVNIAPEYTNLMSVAVDQSSQSAFVIQGDYTNMVGCIAANGRLRGTTGQGILVQSAAQYLNVTEALIRDMASDGIGIEAGARDLRFANCDIYNNATSAGSQINAVLTRPFDAVFRDCNIVGAINASGTRIVGGNTSRTIFRDTGTAGTTATTSGEDLMTYTIPAGTLQPGQQVKLYAYGTLGANANSKTARIFFGAFSLGGILSTGNGSTWTIECKVEIIAPNSQEYTRTGIVSGLPFLLGRGASTVNEANAVIVKVQGQNGTASAGDIVCEGFSVEVVN